MKPAEAAEKLAEEYDNAAQSLSYAEGYEMQVAACAAIAEAFGRFAVMLAESSDGSADYGVVHDIQTGPHGTFTTGRPLFDEVKP